MSKKKAVRAAPKPRNEFVAGMRFRRSGAHGPSRKALRRKDKMELRMNTKNQEAFAA
jgi:hypothetical protein